MGHLCVHSSVGLQNREKACLYPSHLAQSTPRASGNFRGGEQRWDKRGHVAIKDSGASHRKWGWRGPVEVTTYASQTEVPGPPGLQDSVLGWGGAGLGTTGETLCPLEDIDWRVEAGRELFFSFRPVIFIWKQAHIHFKTENTWFQRNPLLMAGCSRLLWASLPHPLQGYLYPLLVILQWENLRSSKTTIQPSAVQ